MLPSISTIQLWISRQNPVMRAYLCLASSPFLLSSKTRGSFHTQRALGRAVVTSVSLPPPPRGIYSHLHFKRAQGSALLLLIGLHRNLTYANSRIITFPATRNKRHRKTALWLCRSIRTKDSLDTCYGSFRCSKHSLLFMSFFARKSLYFFSTPPQKKVTINNR